MSPFSVSFSMVSRSGRLPFLQATGRFLPSTKPIFANKDRPTLGLGFKDSLGELITDLRPTQKRLLPYFSNLLPEGHMRRYLAQRAGVNPEREFFLLWALGVDLPGAITIRPADGHAWPPGADDGDDDDQRRQHGDKDALRFSLAGVQLKFSAINEAKGGLTIPAEGVGGSWIVKLPSREFEGVSENEFSMMTLARLIGINVPRFKLIDPREIANLPEGIGELKGNAFAHRALRPVAGRGGHSHRGLCAGFPGLSGSQI